MSAGAAYRLTSEILGRRLTAVLNHLKLDRLPLVQRTKASALDSRNVHEHILAAAGRLDESVALRRVEPLHVTFCHLLSLCPSVTKFNDHQAARGNRPALPSDVRRR